MTSESTVALSRAQKRPAGSHRALAIDPIRAEAPSVPLTPADGENLPESAGVTDAELVGQFKAGQEAAFVEIMRRHRSRICSVALALLHNRADAEEIAQDTFLRAYRNLHKFRGDASLATWLYRIAFNLARNRYWYFFRRRRHLTYSFDCPMRESSDSTLSDLISSPTPDPAHKCSSEEFLVLVAAAMEKLEPNHREILALRNLKDLSYAQIAESFGINIGTVKSRIARAREHLRSRLAEACPEFAPDAAPSEWFEPTHEPMCAASEGA
jgi:RNA polymerase sigma-70 factor (ECF subfamily)